MQDMIALQVPRPLFLIATIRCRGGLIALFYVMTASLLKGMT